MRLGDQAFVIQTAGLEFCLIIGEPLQEALAVEFRMGLHAPHWPLGPAPELIAATVAVGEDDDVGEHVILWGVDIGWY